MRKFSITFEGISSRILDISQQTTRSQTSSILAMVMLINAQLLATKFYNAYMT